MGFQEKEGFLKKASFQNFPVWVELLPSVRLLSNYLPACTVRAKMKDCSLTPPGKVTEKSNPDQLRLQDSGSDLWGSFWPFGVSYAVSAPRCASMECGLF